MQIIFISGGAFFLYLYIIYKTFILIIIIRHEFNNIMTYIIIQYKLDLRIIVCMLQLVFFLKRTYLYNMHSVSMYNKELQRVTKCPRFAFLTIYRTKYNQLA